MSFERIKNLREDTNLRQTDIANLINVNQKTYSRYETGEREIPIQTLIFLADYYNTSTDYLLNLTDEKRPYPKSKGNKYYMQNAPFPTHFT